MTDSWLIVAAFLVFLMQAGFLLIEAGSVRAKNAVNVAQKNVSDMIICVLCYSLIGFSVMYGLSLGGYIGCLLYTSPSPRDATLSRMPSSA